MVPRVGVGRSSRILLLVGAALFLLALPFLGSAQDPQPTTRPDRSPVDSRRDFRQRYNRLAPGDVQGHYELAEWCKEQRLYQSLLRQAQYVLKLEPAHENAQLLYRLAVEQLRAQNAQARPGEGEEPADVSDGELLTPSQIQKLKFAEFLDRRNGLAARRNGLQRAVSPRGTRSPLQEEFLQVRFEGDVLNEFLDRMSGHPDFSSRERRTRFLTLSPTRQTQLIRQFTGDAFQDRITITNDPLVFRQFGRVLPMVMSGCGTSLCHGGPKAEGWRLRTARPQTDLNLYTNYLILSRVSKGNRRLVDRGSPEDSLLLQYGLPTQRATYQHPQGIPVVFPRGFDDVRYRTILGWIESLTLPEPRTAVALPGYPEPAPEAP